MKTQQHCLVALTSVLFLAFAGSAFGQLPGPIGPPPVGGVTAAGGTGVITNFKTAPLANSETIVVPIDIHTATGATNWAGVRMKMHILDASEVDVVGITYLGVPVPGPATFVGSPFGPASGNAQSVPLIFTVLDPVWPGSGINLTPSINKPVFDLTLHAKNTTPLNNSDVDITMMFSNIYHVPPIPPTFASLTFQAMDSWQLFVTSGITNQSQFHIAGGTFASLNLLPNPPAVNTGHWLHLTDTITFHLVTGVGSNLFATPGGGTAGIGIEHIPEPSRAVLLLLGACAMFVGVRSRRRRKLGEAVVS